MGICRNHPDRDTSFFCSKHKFYLCPECIHCHDPKLYCKHRSGCMISFLEKENQKTQDQCNINKGE